MNLKSMNLKLLFSAICGSKKKSAAQREELKSRLVAILRKLPPDDRKLILRAYRCNGERLEDDRDIAFEFRMGEIVFEQRVRQILAKIRIELSRPCPLTHPKPRLRVAGRRPLVGKG